MPKKVTEELSLNMSVFCKVTGCSKNGVFVQFDDKDGEPTFSGLIYRDNMSSFLEEEFDEGRVLVGDKMRAYIHSIDINGDKVRIVLGDMDMSSTEYAEKKAKLSRAKQQRYQDKVSSAKEEQTDESESAK